MMPRIRIVAQADTSFIKLISIVLHEYERDTMQLPTRVLVHPVEYDDLMRHYRREMTLVLNTFDVSSECFTIRGVPVYPDHRVRQGTLQLCCEVEFER